MREGKGRVHPGPSPSTPSRRREPSRLLAVFGTAVVLAAGVASSVFGTQAHQYSSAAALAFAAAIGSFFGVILTAGMPKAPSRGIAEWLPQALAGAGGFALAPWIVMANRYTDAPPGSEVVFFSVAAWGAMLAIALAVTSRQRLSRIGGVVLALAGAAAVVANWERPSSFSPLVRFPREELLMLVAGLLWVALVLVLLRAARQGSLAPAALRASLGGIAGALVIAAISLATHRLAFEHFVPGVWAFGAAMGFLASGMLVVLRSRSGFGIAAAYLLVPASMSLLLLLEQVLGSLGPNPLLVGPIVAATVATLAGLVLAAGRRDAEEAPAPRALTARLAIAIAALAVLAAFAALALPGMTAAVKGMRADGSQFQATFGLFGFEVAGTWLALGVALAALGIALELPIRAAAWLRSAALTAAVIAWPFVAATPLKTLTGFIPSEVQVDYGSDFARIDFAGGPPIFAAFALGGALVAVAVVLSRRAPALPSQGADESPNDDREVDRT